jgi:hypothetical protein
LSVSFNSSIPSPVRRTDGDDRRVFEKRIFDQLGDVELDEFEQFFVDQIDFREHDQTGFGFEQPADLEMLARLRHDALVGRDDEHATRSMPLAPASMFLTKRSWPGHVDETDPHVAQIELGETDVDRDAALFFFRQRSASTPVKALTSAVFRGRCVRPCRR